MKKIPIMSLFFLIIAGCNATPYIVSPIVTGITMWRDGECRKYYNEEIQILYRATKTSLKDLDHNINEDYCDKYGNYHIIAGEKDRFKITIRKIKPHIAEIRTRINFFGDKPYAELLYQQIDSNTNTINFDEQGKPTKLKTRKKSRFD